MFQNKRRAPGVLHFTAQEIRSMSICSIDPAHAGRRHPETGRLKIKLYATIQENYIPL